MPPAGAFGALLFFDADAAAAAAADDEVKFTKTRARIG